MDKKLFEYFGVFGLYYFLNQLSFFYKNIFLSYIYIYMLLNFIGIGFVIFSFVYIEEWFLLLVLMILIFFFFFS